MFIMKSNGDTVLILAECDETYDRVKQSWQLLIDPFCALYVHQQTNKSRGTALYLGQSVHSFTESLFVSSYFEFGNEDFYHSRVASVQVLNFWQRLHKICWSWKNRGSSCFILILNDTSLSTLANYCKTWRIIKRMIIYGNYERGMCSCGRKQEL